MANGSSVIAPAMQAPRGMRLPARAWAVLDAFAPAAAALAITVVLFSAAVAAAGYDAFEVWGLIAAIGFSTPYRTERPNLSPFGITHRTTAEGQSS